MISGLIRAQPRLPEDGGELCGTSVGRHTGSLGAAVWQRMPRANRAAPAAVRARTSLYPRSKVIVNVGTSRDRRSGHALQDLLERVEITVAFAVDACRRHRSVRIVRARQHRGHIVKCVCEATGSFIVPRERGMANLDEGSPEHQQGSIAIFGLPAGEHAAILTADPAPSIPCRFAHSE
jgi:hypothetical protein